MTTMTARAAALVVLMPLCLIPAPAAAQKVPVGPEFQINTTTGGSQGLYGLAVSAGAGGDFVVVWDGEYDYLDVFGQRYDAGGNALGGDFLVNTTTYYSQAYLGLSVASDPAGNFMVVWNSYNGGLDSDVFAQRYDGAGNPQGGEFMVNTYTTGDQGTYTGIDVAADGSGNFVVVWSDGTYYGGQDGSGGGIFGQRFDGAGTPLGGEFQVNTYTTSGQDRPAVAADAAGNFVVVWMGSGAGDYDGVFGQRFDGTGAMVGGEFLVNTYTTGSQGTYGGLDVAAAPDGRFIVAWGGAGPGDYSGAFARRYDSAGTPQGPEFLVNTYTTGYQAYGGVSAAVHADGSFVVVWSHEYQDGDQIGVFGQQYDSSGAPLGGDFQVNTYTTGDQGANYLRSRPVGVAPTGGGSFVVVWNSYDQDGDQSGVFGQRFGDPGPPIPLTCNPAPLPGCRQSTAVRKGTLLLKDRTPDTKDVLTWKWQRGSATALADYGDPTTEGGTDYVLCVYDESAASQPRLQARAPAGGQCPGRPCWQQFGEKRFEYKNTDLDPDGLRLVRLQRGDEGKAKITVRGKRENLDMPALPLTAPVVAQLQGEHGECWESVYSDFILRNLTTQFKAKPDGPTATTTTTTSTTTIPTTTTTTTTTLPGVCGDDQVNQPSEHCDGTDDGACPGGCSPACFCTCGLELGGAPEVSPDGAHVYIAAPIPGSLATFARNATTGELTFKQVLFDNQAGIDGLYGSQSVAVSPDGAHVYATGEYEDAVSVFSRDAGTGTLTFVEAEFDGVGGVDGIEESRIVVVSPDGAHVYVTGLVDDAVATFSRDAGTGALTFVAALFDGGSDFGTGGMIVSPDGAHVYMAGADSVAALSRDAGTGILTLVETEFDGVGGVDGLDGAEGIAISPDGGHVYVTGATDNAVAVFSRNVSTGELTFASMVGVAASPFALRVSPDGAHVYVASTVPTGVLTAFSRNAVTGALTFVQTSAVGVSAGRVSVSADGAHVYVGDFFGSAVVTFSRDAGTGALTPVETIVAGPGCAASPSGAFLELAGDVLG